MPRKGAAAGPAGGPTGQASLVITAQQSRFHADAVDAPVSKEIWIKDLSISIGAREILNRTELRLKERAHYVLVGRNGTGKSTILKAVADGRIPGIPWSTKVLLLGQSRELGTEDAIGGLSIRETTVLEHVVKSDKVRERYIREADWLSQGIETQRDPLAVVRAYRGVMHQRLEKDLEEANLIAIRRSGARGKKAREQLTRMEEAFEVSQERLNADLSTLDTKTMSEETKAAVDMLTEIQAQLEMMNADAASAKTRTVLLGLGFPVEKIDDSMSKLSGGWRTRCNLACALCHTTDILLLDEPTNFLDLPSIIWLQQYLQRIDDTTVVCVTHDRDFADAVADELLILRNAKLEVFKGNLSLYESERTKKAKWMTEMQAAQDKQKVHMQQSVVNQQQAAKRAGDDKKLKQAASRQKRIDDRLGMQVNAKGHRFSLNRDLGGYHLGNRAAIDIPDFDPPIKIKFPGQPPDLRFPGSLVSLENICFSYPAGRGKRGVEILKDITLSVQFGARVGLCGLNGSGKTTLVSILMGAAEDVDSGSLTATKGTVTRHSRARFARFSQQVVEELEIFGAANRETTALSHLMDFAGAELADKDARSLLGSLGLQGAIASNVPIFALSGGQKVRLALAKLVYSPPHLLVLDEVTTHLDSDTILGLVLALRTYEGGILVVTHDRFFCRCVVEGHNPARFRKLPGVDVDEEPNQDSSDEDTPRQKGVVYRLFKGQLSVLEDGMSQYEAICEKAAAKMTKPQKA